MQIILILQVCAFGPLWEECIVRVGCAAALVRGAAMAGGRAVRAGLPLYQHAYSERTRALDHLVRAHTNHDTFEAFVQRVRDPVPRAPPALPPGGGRLAAALLDHAASAWPTSDEAHDISPRPLKRLGPFKRPPNTTPAPLSAPITSAPPAIQPAPRRNR